jgi:hypothetical protein
MAGFKVSRPSQGSGGFDKKEHEGHLCIFVEPKAEEMTTRYEKEATAARCSYTCCLECRSVVSDALLFGAVLVPQLTNGGEELVVGKLGQGEAKAGQNAPWLLWDPTEEEEAKAEAFLERYATRLQSGKVVVEQPPPEEEPF